MADEDFTTFDQNADPDSDFTITAAKIVAVDMGEDYDAYCGDDKGAAHFGAAFDHDVKITWKSGDYVWWGVTYAISNVVDDQRYWQDNSSQAFDVAWKATNQQVYLILTNHELTTSDSSATFGNRTSGPYVRYLSIERSAGVGDDTDIECRIYTDSGRTSLEDTLALSDLPTGRTYRYVFGIVSRNDADSSDHCDIDVENLNLQEAGVTYYELNLATTVLVETGVSDLQTWIDDVGTTVLAVTGVDDLQDYVDAGGTTVLVVTGGTDIQDYLTEALGTTVLAVTGGTDSKTYKELDLATVVLAVTGVSDSQDYIDDVGTTVLAVTGGTDLQDYNAEALGGTVLIVTGLTDAQTWLDDVGTVVLALTGGTDIAQYVDADGTVVLAVTGGTDTLVSGAYYYELNLAVVVLVAVGLTDEQTFTDPDLTYSTTPVSALIRSTTPADLTYETTPADLTHETS